VGAGGLLLRQDGILPGRYGVLERTGFVSGRGDPVRTGRAGYRNRKYQRGKRKGQSGELLLDRVHLLLLSAGIDAWRRKSMRRNKVNVLCSKSSEWPSRPSM